jgi:histidine triad (HIT) family protein
LISNNIIFYTKIKNKIKNKGNLIMETIFTKIIKRKIKSYIIYEDDLVISFLDIEPITKGHSLVVTKEEYKSILEIPENIFIHMCRIVQKISKVLVRTFEAKGINLLNNNGHVAGQTLFHYHIHLIPRFYSDEISFFFKDQSFRKEQMNYEKIQENIIKNLNNEF